MQPRPKVTVRAIFLRTGICRCQIIGIGSVIIIKSMVTLTTLVATTLPIVDPQTPGRRGSQFFANGRQMRKASRVLLTPNDMTSTIVTYAMERKDLLEPNMVM